MACFSQEKCLRNMDNDFCSSLYLLGIIKFSHDSDKTFICNTLFFTLVTGVYTIYMIPGLWGGPVSLMFGILPRCNV